MNELPDYYDTSVFFVVKKFLCITLFAKHNFRKTVHQAYYMVRSFPELLFTRSIFEDPTLNGRKLMHVLRYWQHSKEAITHNYVRGLNYGWIFFGLATLWGIVFCILYDLGANFLALIGFTAVVSIVAGIAYGMENRRIAGYVFPLHGIGILLCTTLFVFNPSKEYIAVYGTHATNLVTPESNFSSSQIVPVVVQYRDEPYIGKHKPSVWQHAFFYKDQFTTTINKYVEFEKKDALVTFTITFIFSPEYAKMHFTKLDRRSDEIDKNAAQTVMQELVTKTVRAVIAEATFEQSMRSADDLLYSLTPQERYDIKRKMFRGALENFLKRSENQAVDTLLYIPYPPSAAISVSDPIYSVIR